MCGRFALTRAPELVRQHFGYEEQPNFPPRATIAPTEPIAIVVQENGRRAFKLVRWGFLPGWVKEPDTFPLLINARSETAGTKAAFRAAIRHRRCLVPADAFYEWQREGKVKTPYRIRRVDGGGFAMAGLWETFISPEGSEIDTACILTTGANGVIGAIHDRMPVMIEREQFDLWLDPFSDVNEAAKLMRPAPDDVFMLEPVDPRVPKPERRAVRAVPEKRQGELF
jgi:putative SOS response-associated peptidase YedK